MTRRTPSLCFAPDLVNVGYGKRKATACLSESGNINGSNNSTAVPKLIGARERSTRQAASDLNMPRLLPLVRRKKDPRRSTKLYIYLYIERLAMAGGLALVVIHARCDVGGLRRIGNRQKNRVRPFRPVCRCSSCSVFLFLSHFSFALPAIQCP